jgi:uncharacterized integral membrane protein
MEQETPAAGSAGREPRPEAGTPAPLEAQRRPTAPLTRASAVWTATAVGLVLLVVVLVFILENLQDVKVSFFTVHWKIPLGVDLLFAALLGGLVVFTAGAVRLLQLRRQSRLRSKGSVQGT